MCAFASDPFSGFAKTSGSPRSRGWHLPFAGYSTESGGVTSKHSIAQARRGQTKLALYTSNSYCTSLFEKTAQIFCTRGLPLLQIGASIRTMRTIIVLITAIFIYLASAGTADAGVMLRDVAIPSDNVCQAPVMPDMAASPQRKQEYRELLQDLSSGMVGVLAGSSHNGGQAAVATRVGALFTVPILLEVHLLANAKLPPHPVLCGLLKPS